MHGWVLISDAAVDEDTSLGHQSIGYYLDETPKQITICQSSKSNKEFRKSEDTNVNAVFSIPKKAILRMRKIWESLSSSQVVA